MIKKFHYTGAVARFLKKPWPYQQIVMEAFLWLAITRFVIRFLPFKALLFVIGTKPEPESDHTVGIDYMELMKNSYETEIQPGPVITDITNAVKSVSRRVPWQSKCLVQAASAKKMMNRRKIENHLFLGVSASGLKGHGPTKRRNIHSHAWLIADHNVVLGGENLDDYIVVSRF